MGFDPYNRVLKIREPIWDSNSQHGSSLGSVKVHSLTLFGTPKSMWYDSRVFLLARNLATLCLSREPKAKAMIVYVQRKFLGNWGYVYQYFLMLRFLKGKLKLIVINYWWKGLIVQTIVVGRSCGAICEGFINWE